ncbi:MULTISPECIES: hypothetical protein [Brevibacterium]|nr:MULTISPECIES: hypothetical protein [Brevibacterium]
MSEHLLNFLSIFTGEGAILWDATADEPIGEPRELIRRGTLATEAAFPVEAFERLVFQQGTVEAGLIAYNAQLMLQAMGLGGWLFGGMDSNALLGAHRNEGIPGFGFEFRERADGGMPDPVGLPGCFETLVPPFTSGPAEAVERFVARKFGDGGLYRSTSQGPYQDNAAIKTRVERYDEATMAYFVSVLNGLMTRYGGYPGTFPPVLTSVYLQAQHIDVSFYDTFYTPESLLTTHRTHVETWHDG